MLEREKKFFFCQIEALETAIYLNEVASRFGDSWMEAMLRDANESSNPGLPRIAFKMATGSGKTVVMGMMIAWQALNKFAKSSEIIAISISLPGVEAPVPDEPNRMRLLIRIQFFLIYELKKCTASRTFASTM